MELRKITLALLLLSFSTALSAQTLNATTVATKARTARSVGNDLRNKRVQRAATTILKDKDVQRHVPINKNVQARITDTNVKASLSKAKADAKRDPVKFGEKAYKEAKKHKKRKFTLFQRKSKKSTPRKR